MLNDNDFSLFCNSGLLVVYTVICLHVCLFNLMFQALMIDGTLLMLVMMKII